MKYRTERERAKERAPRSTATEGSISGDLFKAADTQIPTAS